MKNSTILAISVALAACNVDDSLKPSCEDEMNKVRKRMGTPEQITNYDSTGYKITTWWYNNFDAAYTFAESTRCDVSTYKSTSTK